MLSKDTQVQIAKLAVEAITGKTAAKKPFPDRANLAVRKLIREAIKKNECLLMQSQWTHNLTETKIGTAARLIFDGAVEAVKEAKKAKAGTELDLFRKAAAKAAKKTGKVKKAAGLVIGMAAALLIGGTAAAQCQGGNCQTAAG